MDMLTLLRTRRSIRQFKDKPVEKEKADLLIETLLRSPSSRNLNPWEFVLVDDPAMLKQLSQCKAHGAEFLAGAPLGVVIAADPEKCDVWIEDCSIASILLQMTAHSLGLGSCWVQVRLRKQSNGESAESKVREIIGCADHYNVLSIIGIGYPDEHPDPHPGETLDRTKIHWNGI